MHYLIMLILGCFIILHFGLTLIALASLLFTGILIILSIIDWKTQCLPDQWTLSLLWLGLLVNIQTLFVPLEQAVLGAVVGYLFLWMIAQLFYFLTGKVGIGGGDLKLFSAIGAWFGWQELPWIMAAASLTGLIFFIGMMKIRDHHKDDPIAFGPFLAIFGWVALWLCPG